jgi:hypothetical protein
MYDMYPWPRHAPAEHGESGRTSAQARARATQAVQIALDRRDNGGDPQGPAGAPAEPAAGPARQ